MLYCTGEKSVVVKAYLHRCLIGFLIMLTDSMNFEPIFI